MHIITVTFQIRPEHMAAFLPAMQANALASVQDEPGCQQFDVCVSLDDPNRVFLYEVYDSPEAFQAHLATPHFQAFNQRTAPWVESKQVQGFQRP
ncbi:MAG: antibiotic biosynthesis monooxygenase [Ramlibacter sp.]|nr:antibiotic biosynthesis monooxygenase [Ramlibacter sp.]